MLLSRYVHNLMYSQKLRARRSSGMYESYFGFKQAPFSLTPNTQLFLNFGGYLNALQLLNAGLQQNQGMLKITGEAGLGKTMLCRLLLSQLEHNPAYITAYIPNPCLSPEQLQVAVADELGLSTQGLVGSHSLIKALNEHLIRLALDQKRVILIVDEAQAMPVETLEALRLITNLETETQKLVQIILFAQPQLDVLLRDKDLSQFQQRITASAHLSRLSEEETHFYIQHRALVSGQGDKLFSRLALRAIYQASRGLPRLINVVAHESLLLAYQQHKHRVNWHMVKVVAKANPALSLPSLLSTIAGLKVSA